MSKAGQTKRHSPKTVHVAQKHLKKAEPQRAPNVIRKTRPVRSAERREIIHRLRTGQVIRRITSEMGISYAMVQQIISSNNMTFITGTIALFKLMIEEDKQAAALLIEENWFSVPAELYAQTGDLLGDAFKARTPVFIIAEWCNENFVALHVGPAKAGAA